MAESVHLFLTANGAGIHGDSSHTSLGRENSIECVYYDQSAVTPRDSRGGMATGRRHYEPILIRKRVDKSSPLLAKALTKNEAIEATFKFYRPNPTGDGTTEQFYTVTIKQARIASVRVYVPFTLDPATSTHPPLEEVTMVFQTISWTYTDGGVTHEDVSPNR